MMHMGLARWDNPGYGTLEQQGLDHRQVDLYWNTW